MKFNQPRHQLHLRDTLPLRLIASPTLLSWILAG